ncbi:hypothetical protein [Halopelagius longus]|uniref:HEAT repeat domain-containing protein n=1 Tax=Halopelagius longus TaxID=1236180 RepID=A0A1H1B5C3_9EURY|nr:hypothetical protein [Halopelagius longus]RDI70650.1 hypothetical protein DWB78_02310 [Halopelagius longus]SDQ47117.1 hypothetical protein SAMN05216278_1645 [Halopelagius longus]
MPTPEENHEIALDESSDREDRERAINQLEAANECDMLADLVRSDGLEDALRKQAFESLAHPQCKPTLETLVENGEVPEAFEGDGRTLLEQTPDDAGAGP